MNALDKPAIYQEAKALFIDWYGQDIAEQGACLYWTQCAMKTLDAHGERVLLQAGDMLWPCAIDRGNNGTHFGYEWTPDNPFSVEQMCNGNLPEVHIWCALPDRNEIVDFSTAGFKTLVKERHGLPWEMPDPPLYLWGIPPQNVLYRANLEAIRFVWQFIIRKQVGVMACSP